MRMLPATLKHPVSDAGSRISELHRPGTRRTYLARIQQAGIGHSRIAASEHQVAWIAVSGQVIRVVYQHVAELVGEQTAGEPAMPDHAFIPAMMATRPPPHPPSSDGRS